MKPLLLLLLPLVVCGCAAQQDASAPAPVPKYNGSVPPSSLSRAGLITATRAQVRACMDSEDELAARKKALDERLAAHEDRLLDVQKESRALTDDQARVPSNDRAKVDAYNRRREAHNARVAQVNAEGDALQAGSDDVNARVASYNAQCASMIFKVEDREAVLRERQLERDAKAK